MLQEKNHLSSTRRGMKKQIEYLNGIYGRGMGNPEGRKAQGAWRKADWERREEEKRKNKGKRGGGETGKQESSLLMGKSAWG